MLEQNLLQHLMIQILTPIPLLSKQSNIIKVYQAQFIATLHKQNWLHFKLFIRQQMNLKELNAIAGLSKFFILLAIFLSESYANLCIHMSEPYH